MSCCPCTWKRRGTNCSLNTSGGGESLWGKTKYELDMWKCRRHKKSINKNKVTRSTYMRLLLFFIVPEWGSWSDHKSQARCDQPDPSGTAPVWDWFEYCFKNSSSAQYITGRNIDTHWSRKLFIRDYLHLETARHLQLYDYWFASFTYLTLALRVAESNLLHPLSSHRFSKYH